MVNHSTALPASRPPKATAVARRSYKAAAAYPLVLVQSPHTWGAHAPDVPGCVATGRTIVATERRMRAALARHLRGLEEDGDPWRVPGQVHAAAAATDE